jgi:hypothetical protein
VIPPVKFAACDIDSQETTSPCTNGVDEEHAVSKSNAAASNAFFI